MDHKKKKVLITGGSGLLAVNWAVTLKHTHHVTLGLHNRDISLEGIDTIRLDTVSFEKIKEQVTALQPDLIIHTAGITSVELCENDPELAYKVNVVLASDLASIAAFAGITFVQISTDHMFDGKQANVDETAATGPLNVYSTNKLEAEKKVLDVNPSALVIRTNFYGWGPGYRASFSDTILSSLRKGKEITLFTDVYFTPILIQTLITSVHELLDKKQSGIFNVVGDERISKFEFGIKLAREFDLDTKNILPIRFADKEGLTKRPLDLSLSNKKICTLLGHELGDIKTQFQQLHDLESDPSINNIRKL